MMMLGWLGASFRDLTGSSVFVSYANDIVPVEGASAGQDALPSAAKAVAQPAIIGAPARGVAADGRPAMAVEAERIAYAIGERGFKVFFDKLALRPGETFNSRIRHEIELSSLFVFLVTERAVTPPNYALTELKFAMGKWPHPKGRVLPVMMRETRLDALPEYLKSVQILKPVGNVAAEVADEAAKLMRKIRAKRRPQLGLAIAILLVGILAAIFGRAQFGPAAGFQIYDGYVLNDPGEVIAKQEVKSFDNCRALCERSGECKAFSYSPKGSCALAETYSQFEPREGGRVGVRTSEAQPKLK
jgi:hypothetical protein